MITSGPQPAQKCMVTLRDKEYAQNPEGDSLIHMESYLLLETSKATDNVTDSSVLSNPADARNVSCWDFVVGIVA